MHTFLMNISRYPSFFITSLLGLIFIILKPIKTKFKNLKIIITFSLLIIISLLIILKTMFGL